MKQYAAMIGQLVDDGLQRSHHVTTHFEREGGSLSLEGKNPNFYQTEPFSNQFLIAVIFENHA